MTSIPGRRIAKLLRRQALALAVTAAAILAVPVIAAPEGRVVIRGAERSSHLRLMVSGGRLLVHGYMYPVQPGGCSFTRRRSYAACGLAGVGSIEVIMGPGNDKVEVLDPLPVPLIAHLGAGSDGFIGNSEPDTCYSEGSKKNRCITRGGNDVCITGQQNSDCFLGPGNDVCIHGAGSDGCWGGPGNDVCHMGPGMDGCHGGPGNDRLYGGPQPDRLFGGPGRDYCNGGPGVGRSFECETGPGH